MMRQLVVVLRQLAVVAYYGVRAVCLRLRGTSDVEVAIKERDAAVWEHAARNAERAGRHDQAARLRKRGG